jgi:Fic family protein
MEKKITKIDRFNQLMAISEVAQNEELVDFINHEIELLKNKSANKKPSKTQEQNEVLKADIVEVLRTFAEGATASEVLGASEKFAGLSNQKISTMLNQLVKVGTVKKTTDKKRSIFSVVD